MTTLRTGAAGRDVVALTVKTELSSDWQNISAENDDGIDGIVFLKYRNRFSGRLIFVQVKSGKSYVKRYAPGTHDGHVALDLGREYLDKHRSRWRALPGPVLLAYVEDPSDRTCPVYWQDLKLAAAYSETNKGVVLIPRNQRLGSHSKGALRKVCGSRPDSMVLPEIDMGNEKSALIKPQFGRKDALRVYRAWRETSSDSCHPDLGRIEVTNLGWRHITRKSRRLENIVNSFLLLEAARKIIESKTPYRQIGYAKKRERRRTIDIVDHLALRAIVRFRHRAPGPVQVIVRRTRRICSGTGAVHARLRFLSVHEIVRDYNHAYG